MVVHSLQPSTNPLNAVVGAVATGVFCSIEIVPFNIEVSVVGIVPLAGSSAYPNH
jgi:hypothetical protein